MNNTQRETTDDWPEIECAGCDTLIVRHPIRIPGTDVLGYERFCDDCIEAQAEDHQRNWRDERLPNGDTK